MQTVELERLNMSGARRVLDAGCGRGRHAIAAKAAGAADVVGLDLCANDVAHARDDAKEFFKDSPNPTFIAGDIMRLPFPDNAFDLVICSEVLEHLPDFRGALQELARVCAPGGRFAISVPRYWPERICWTLSAKYAAEPGGHVRIFREDRLRREVARAGFSFQRRHWAHALHSPYWWLRCLFWDSQDNNPLINQYRKFLEWDLLAKPQLTRALESVTNPLMGKSVVMYFTRETL